MFHYKQTRLIIGKGSINFMKEIYGIRSLTRLIKLQGKSVKNFLFPLSCIVLNG